MAMEERAGFGSQGRSRWSLVATVAAASLGVAGSFALWIGAGAADEPSTEQGTDPGDPLTEEQRDGETPDADGCEEDEEDGDKGDGGGGGDDNCGRGDPDDEDGMFGRGDKESGGNGDKDPPEPPDEGEDSAGDGSPAEEDPKHPPEGGDQKEPSPDPQGGNEPAPGTGGTPPGQGSDGDPSSGASGGSGEGGGGDEGDGAKDPAGGESDGHTNENCESAGAEGETPPPTNPKPPGGALGNNPGFLNQPVAFKYRSLDPVGTQLGIGWDANVFERLVPVPSQNPNAAFAWHPGNGACHYFFPNGQSLTPEAAIQDTHSLSVNVYSQQSRYVLSDKHNNQTHFDVYGHITLKQDKWGNTNQYLRSPLTGQLTGITSSYGHPNMWTFDYFPTGRLKSATDFSGRVTNFSYDATGRLAWVAFPATPLHPTGKKFQYTYYSGTGNPAIDGKMSAIIDPVGVARVEWAYNALGNVTQMWRGNRMHTWTMTSNGPTRDVVDFNGNLRRYTFLPNLHYPVRAELFTRGLRATDPPSYVWQYEYNPQRQITRAVLPDGKTYDYAYDPAFNLSQRTITPTDPNLQPAIWSWAYGPTNHATSVTAPSGAVTLFNRDAFGCVTSIVSPNAGGGSAVKSFEYTPQGQLKKVINANGRTKEYIRHTTGPFNGWPHTVRITPAPTDPPAGGCAAGDEYLYTYNARGYPVSVTDPAGAVAASTRDPVDRVTELTRTAQVNLRTAFVYGGLGLLSAVHVDNRGADGLLDASKPYVATSVQYDLRRRVQSMSVDFDAAGPSVHSFVRDGLGNLTQLTTATNRVAQWSWDERGLPLRATTGVQNPVWTDYAFHANGTLASVRDALGGTATFGIDGFGRLTSSASPTGQSHSRILTAAGDVAALEFRDALGVLQAKQSFQYDNRHRVTAEVFDRFGHGGPPEQATWSYQYDALSNVTNAVTPLGRSYTHTHYGCGRPRTSTNDATSGVATHEYDGAGRQVRLTDHETEGGATKDFVQEWSYDGVGNVVETREVDANNSAHVLKTNYSYDGLQRLCGVQGPTGSAIKYKYNYGGLPVEVETLERVPGQANPIVHRTYCEWDRDGRLAQVTDPSGAVTQWIYDEHGREKQVVYANQSSVTYTYDLAGNVVGIAQSTGTTVAQTFDAAGRLTSRTVSPGNGVFGTTTETYTYDVAGRLVRAADDDTAVEFTYDSMGNVLTESQGPPLGPLQTVTRGFDKDGCITSVAYPGGLVLDRTFDAAGRLAEIRAGSLTVLQRAYARTTLLAAHSYLGGAVSESYQHDGFDRLVSMTSAAPGQSPFFDVQYAYDDQHRRLYERRLHAGMSGDLYSYDDLSRVANVLRGVADPLLELQTPGSQTWQASVTYAYDAVGARTSVTSVPWGGAGTVTGYQSNALHQYLTIGGTPRAYDANGNLATDGTHVYAYDYRNQLVAVFLQSNGSPVASYEYDCFGRRTKKQLPSGQATYVYDQDDLVEVRDAAGTVTHEFVFAEDTDEVVAARCLDTGDYNGNSNTTERLWFAYHLDGVNSVRAITDAAGAVVETYTYDEFGTATRRNPAGTVITASRIGNPFAYTARELDPETGLLYYRARYYEPATGVFLQRDPFEYVDSFNPYTYVNNQPFNANDPFGRGWFDKIKSGIASVGKAAVGAAVGFADSYSFGLAGKLADKVLPPSVTQSTAYKAGKVVGEVAGVATQVASGAGLAFQAGKAVAQLGAKKALAAAASGLAKSASSAVKAAAGAVNGLAKAAKGAAGGVKGAGQALKCLARSGGRGGRCFAAGTLVLTAAGQVPIEQLRPGDEIVAWDEATERAVSARVVDTIRSRVGTLYELRVAGETLRVSDEHPFWVVGRGWVESDAVRAGDRLLTASGAVAAVDAVHRTVAACETFNVTVERFSTYFVGTAGFVAHNAACPGEAAANRAKNLEKGIPESQLGPSGKPKMHNVDHGGSKKAAKEAAQHGGDGPPMHHPSPKTGQPHYHSTKGGEKKLPNVHHNY